MSEVISSFRSLRAGSQVFALLMLFVYVIVHTMWSGKSMQLLYVLPLGMLCLSAISMMFLKSKERCTDHIHKVALSYTVKILRWRTNLQQWFLVGPT